MKETKIQFADFSWNPWQGCQKISPGCKFCYMMRDKERYGQDPTKVFRSAKRTFEKPLIISKPSVIFTCSWSDWFIAEADAWRAEAWRIIKATPHHRYLIFSKRIERALDCLPADWGAGYENVMLVATAENQEQADLRVPLLEELPARWRGVSTEPLLSEIKLNLSKLDWLVIGGESGNDTGRWRYRPCKLSWIRDLTQQGREAGVATFVKQLGTNLYKVYGLKNRSGGEISEFPLDLQVRDFPEGFLHSERD